VGARWSAGIVVPLTQIASTWPFTARRAGFRLIEQELSRMAQAKSIDPFPPPGVPPSTAATATPGPMEELDSGALVDESPRSRIAGLLGWVLFGATTIAILVLYFGVHRPTSTLAASAQQQLDARSTELEQTRTALAHADAELATSRTQLTEQQDRAGEIATANDELSVEIAALTVQRQQLARTVASKDAELAAAQLKLETNLGAEIASGEISVRKRGDELVVGVDDRVLFARGDAELEARGQKVMRRVAETLRANPDRVFEIAGHTDDDPVAGKLAERYPTNWELSTARATNVVRFLVEQCEVTGRQLIAAGYAAERPAASNKTNRGRQKNRRIEIIMRAQPLAPVK
jgi:chemotaxis protein MotB